MNSAALFSCLIQAMSAYGYEIVQTLIVDIEPDVNVKRAMNEINAGNVYNLINYLCSSVLCDI